MKQQKEAVITAWIDISVIALAWQSDTAAKDIINIIAAKDIGKDISTSLRHNTEFRTMKSSLTIF